jgi:hypothetical protein
LRERILPNAQKPAVDRQLQRSSQATIELSKSLTNYIGMCTTEELTRKVAQWATEVGMRAAQLPSKPARAAFLAAQHREIMKEAGRSGMSECDALILAQSCVEGADRIMRELLARGMPMPQGRA